MLKPGRVETSKTSDCENPPRGRLVRSRYEQNLFEGRDAVSNSVQRHHPERAHALPNGDFGKFACVGAADDEFTDFIGNGHGFDNRHAASIAGILAALAATAAIECNP